MTAQKKESPKAECNHHYVVTGWMIKGGHQQAIQMRCAHCLRPVSLEELSCKEWKESEGI